MGGYYLLDARDLDQVVVLIGQLYEMEAWDSGVEIRMVASEQ